MSQQIKVQGGIVVYSNANPSLDVDFTIKGQLTLTGPLEVGIVADPGLAGQVLTSGGPGVPLTWENPPSQGIVINTQSDDYTLQLSDAFNTLIRMTKATPTVLTIPNDANIDLPVGSAVLISWNGLGQVSIVGEAGVTVDTPDTYDIGKQFGKITAIKTEPNHWEIEGNLVPL